VTTKRRIHLLRHAKSSWDDPELTDHDRPLAPRGLKATRRLARWIAQEDIRPDLVLCSTATRAQETLARVAAALGSPPTLVEDGLYHASADALLGRLQQLPDAVGVVLLVGHNPGLEDLCDTLAGVATRLPTGALATFAADIGSWGELAPSGASLVSLVLPRELGRDQDTR